MFNVGANYNNIEYYTLDTIFIYNLGYTSCLLLDNNDTNHNIQTHNLLDLEIHILNTA